MHSKDIISLQQYQEAADWLLSHTEQRPHVAVICGSGLGLLAETLQEQEVFPYSQIPGFPHSTVQGHLGRLVFGRLQGRSCVFMQGRFHMYEGHSLSQTAFPVRVFKLIGVETLLVTNAAGSLVDSLRPGDIMIIKDHVNFPGLSGLHPLRGPNADRFGPRFPAMSGCYDARLRRVAMEIGKQLGVAAVMREGVYAMVGGPNFETIAEARLLHQLGIDAVGMSTAPEVVVATHCGLRVFGLSLITNKVVKSYEDEESVDHEAVLEIGRLRAQTLQKLVTEVIARMDVNNNTCSSPEDHTGGTTTTQHLQFPGGPHGGTTTTTQHLQFPGGPHGGTTTTQHLQFPGGPHGGTTTTQHLQFPGGPHGGTTTQHLQCPGGPQGGTTTTQHLQFPGGPHGAPPPPNTCSSPEDRREALVQA